MSEGFIVLHRKLLRWEWSQNPEMVSLFIHLLLLANHEKGKWQGIELERGQLITGRKSLAKETGISQQSVRTCLTRLKSTNEITIKSTSKFSIITIVKYSDYQDKKIKSTSTSTIKSTNNQPAINQQLTTNNNGNNVNNEEQVKCRNFVPPSLEEVTNYCNERGNQINAQHFLDFYTAKGWLIGKNKMKDWRAAVRTWEQRQKDNPKSSSEDDDIKKLKQKYAVFNS